MDRTVPSSGNEEIKLYLRTYYSLLRSSSDVQTKSLFEAHKRMNSALHIAADEPEPDMAAFIYSILRIPDCIDQVQQVIMGQSELVFAMHGFPNVEEWQQVGAPGRRRRNFFDGKHTLAVYIASRSDIDDIVPILVAYQIERQKMQYCLNKPKIIDLLTHVQEAENGKLEGGSLVQLAHMSEIAAEDLHRLSQVWQGNTAVKLLDIAQNSQSISIRSLASSLADYKRATRSWWKNVEENMPGISFADRPVYFVSSNTHSLPNLLTGFALQIEEQIHQFIHDSNSEELTQEYHDIVQENVPSSLENFLYYALKKVEQVDTAVQTARRQAEENIGLVRIPSEHAFDIEVQVTPLNKLIPENLDPRLALPGLDALHKSNALIINVDYPLGMAAYQVLAEIASNIAEVRGVYIMGKAATLNGRIGDIMIPSVVHDEHSLNTYLFPNCFTADDISPYLIYGSVMDNQKAITVPGTFLQNEGYMSVFYQEGYTDMEMEAGPYLSSIYEMVRPQRHPYNELVNLYSTTFPIGILHYASDTPFSKGKNLGAQNLSYFGMDPTYATMVAILRAILHTELKHLEDAK